MPRRLALFFAAAALACARPPARAQEPEGPTRLAILEPDYGASLAHPEAIELGARVDLIALPLADSGAIELGDALGAGPLILVWIGGAEHERLTAWIRELDRSLAQLEDRATTMVFVRPLEPDAALRWAVDLRIQTPVASDPNRDVARMLGMVDESTPPLEFGVLIIADEALAYRKLGGRRPELAELLAVLDGEAESLRCCPGACVGAVCLGGFAGR